jgi:hypothetical protein
MEELQFYLDLVEKLGDPFTVFERDWPDDEVEQPAESPGSSVSIDDEDYFRRWRPAG